MCYIFEAIKMMYDYAYTYMYMTLRSPQDTFTKRIFVFCAICWPIWSIHAKGKTKLLQKNLPQNEWLHQPLQTWYLIQSPINNFYTFDKSVTNTTIIGIITTSTRPRSTSVFRSINESLCFSFTFSDEKTSKQLHDVKVHYE